MKFIKIGTGSAGFGKKTGRPYIRLDLNPELLSQLKGKDLSKIYLFENYSKEYAVMAITNENNDQENNQNKHLSISNGKSDIYRNGLGEPLPWESEKIK